MAGAMGGERLLLGVAGCAEHFIHGAAKGQGQAWLCKDLVDHRSH